MVNWVVGIRGIKHDADRFINELSSQYLPYTGIDPKTGIIRNDLVLQVRVCPIQLFDISFPEPQSEKMAATLFRGGGEPINEHHKLLMWGARKAMGMQPIENEFIKAALTKYPEQPIPSYMQNIEIWPIGMKKDWIQEFPINNKVEMI